MRMVRYTVRCYMPTADGYVPIESLNPKQRRELSDRIVGNMGAAMQDRINRAPGDYERMVRK
jgi:hypothetical protein